MSPLQSVKKKKGCKEYWKMPPGPGHYFDEDRRKYDHFWGKRHMIDFLMELSETWGYFEPDHPFGIGDISKECGGEMRAGHLSHRRGVDVDIYVIRKDGLQKRTHYLRRDKDDPTKDEYDQKRTTELAQLVFDTVGRHMVDKFFFDDPDVQRAVGGITNPWNARDQHGDHFHIRLKAKAPTSPTSPPLSALGPSRQPPPNLSPDG